MIVRERTFRVKVILDGTKVVSRKVVQIGPTIERPAEPDEKPEPVEDTKWREMREIGAWSRMLAAVRDWRSRHGV